MCGRYTIISKLQVIEKEFQIDVSDILDRYAPNVNVSAGEEALVITDEEPHKAQMLSFGFTPSWAKKKILVINARSEGDHNSENDPRYQGAKGILTKPMFRQSIRSRRCLVIADAFIEGTTQDKLSKPYLVYRRDNKRPFAMAGIWDVWTDPATGKTTRGFAIVTTAPNFLLEQIPHHRSPLILDEAAEKIWLSKQSPLQDITALMQPFDASTFNAYPISPTIKSAKNKDLSLLQPTGELLLKEYDYIFYQELELQGMGETPARKRRQDEQLSLFDDEQ